MGKPGLIAKRILRRGGGLATYWVRPEQRTIQLARLAKAKLDLHMAGEAAPVVAVPKPALTASQSAMLTSPSKRRNGAKLPEIAPPTVTMSRKQLDTSSIPAGEAYSSKHVGQLVEDNRKEIMRMGLELDAAFVNGRGTRHLDAVPDVQMTLVLGSAVAGTYNAQTGDMMIRKSLIHKMLEPAVTGSSPSYDNIRATQIWTHEQLHAASNRNRPPTEPIAEKFAPNRWIEEATTELLSHHYNSQTVTALTGKPVAKVSPLIHAMTLDGDVEIATETGVAYVNPSMRFVHLVGYMTGVGGGDKIEDINRVVLGYAAEIKKRGADRYEYLAEEVMKAHGVEQETPMYAAAKKELVPALRQYMGTNAPSRMTGESDNSAEGAIKAALLKASEGLAEAALPMNTPLATVTSIPPTPVKVRPAMRAGRRKTLKTSL